MAMKKLICLLMMTWLPLSMATAAIMSTEMMVSNDLHTIVEKAQNVESCHQHTDNQSKDNQPTHQCNFCNTCLLASSGAVLTVAPMFITVSGSANEHAPLTIPAYSDHSSTTIKPPILR